MSKATIKNNRLILLSLCIFFLFISCINELDSEISPGTVPIKFTTKINKTNTRVTNTAFDKGDKVGLYAMLSSTPITEKRYIDNLQLECGEKNVFIRLCLGQGFKQYGRTAGGRDRVGLVR